MPLILSGEKHLTSAGDVARPITGLGSAHLLRFESLSNYVGCFRRLASALNLTHE